MAIPFLNNINLDDNQLLNAKLHVTSSAPTAAEGQIYFDSTAGVTSAKYYDGAAWVSLIQHTYNNGTFINLTEAGTDATRTLTADLSATGTPDATVYLRGDNTWSPISGIPGTYTFDVSADTGGSGTVNSGDTLDIAGGTYITTDLSAGPSIEIIHDSTSRTDTTSTDAPGYGGTFEAVTSVTTNATGHVTAIDVSTVTIPASDDTTYQLSVGAGAADTAVVTLDASSGTDTTLTVGVQDQALTISETTGVNGTITLGLNSSIEKSIIFTEDITIQGELDMDNDINMNSNSITGLPDPQSPQDAATKAYVDGLVEGGLTFKDGFNATTGAIDGGGNLTSGATRVAISVGDYYVVTTAGDFYGDSSYPLTVGDSVIAKEDAAAGASTVTDWVIIQGDEGVVDLTSGNGGTSTGNALTSNTNARGSVTVNSFAYGGTTNVGHVPSGGSATTFLRGDGTWVTPTNTTPNDATITLDAGTNLTGGGNFTTDQATNETITFNLATADASTIGAGNVAAGTGISVSYSSGTATVTNTETNSSNTFATTITDTATITHNLNTRDVIIQLYDEQTHETVYADVDRISTTQATITFASTPTNDIRVLVQKIG